MQCNPNYNIAFFGTPDLCLPYLHELEKSGFRPSLIVTNPDRKIGRGAKREVSIPAPKRWALERSLPVEQPAKITPEFVEKLKETKWDLFIIVAYGQIVPQTLLDIPEYGALNIHYSLLPRWRGASPVESTILAGDTETGVAIQRMVYKLDAGPLVAQSHQTLTGHELSNDLRNDLSQTGAELLIETIPKYIAGEITPVEQTEAGITTCWKMKKSNGEVSLSEILDTKNADIQEKLWRMYRAYFPWPGLYYFDEGDEESTEKKRVKISKASFNKNENKFVVEKIIPEGKSEQDFIC